jgi:hypothetical protein
MFIARNIAKKYVTLFPTPASRSCAEAARLRQKIIHRAGLDHARALIQEAVEEKQITEAQAAETQAVK